MLELTGKRAPQTGLEGKFNVFHGAACGLLYGKATPAEYEDDIVRDPRLVAVRERIEVEIDETLAADQATVVLAHTTDTLLRSMYPMLSGVSKFRWMMPC